MKQHFQYDYAFIDVKFKIKNLKLIFQKIMKKIFKKNLKE